MEPGEQLLWSGRPRQRPGPAEWFAFAVPLLVLIVNHSWLDWALFGVAGVVGVGGYLSRAKTFYGITDHRFIIVTGLQTKVYAMARIESATISRGARGNMWPRSMEPELLTIRVWVKARRKVIKVVLDLQDDAKPVRDLIESLRRRQPAEAYA